MLLTAMTTKNSRTEIIDLPSNGQKSLSVVKISDFNIWRTFMSRRISDTSLGSAARNMKLAIFSFYPFFLCSVVL